MSLPGEKRSAIGITSIWGEGAGVERVSLIAIAVHCVRQAIENVRRSSITSLLTVITISVAIFLLGIFLLFIQNASQAVSRGGGELTVMVFIKDGASQGDLDSLSRQIHDLSGGQTVTYIDKGQALQFFRASLGDDAKILEGLDADNPLPASLQVQLTSAEEAEAVYGKILKRLADSSKVESVRYSRGGVLQIRKMISLVRVVGGVGMLFLFVIAGFIIANTIKLALYNHRTEIEIMQLVGARRPSIYVPYLLEGFVQGIAGAAVGLIGVFLVFLLVRNFLGESEVLRVIMPSFVFIPGLYVGIILAAGSLVGLIGSFLAIRRFLQES
ncbi:MAG: cell division protein FtsX [Pseudomonadota bacterium]|jgi:cell division transport system permease protein